MRQRELQQREDDVEPQRRRIHFQPGARLVARQEILFARQSAHQRRAAAILRQKRPAEVLDGIAEMHELPIEDRRDAIVAFEKVAEAVVAVDDRQTRALSACGGAARRRRDGPSDAAAAPSGRTGTARNRAEAERRCRASPPRPIRERRRHSNREERRERRRNPPRASARAPSRPEPLRAPGQRRVALDALAQEERRAEDGRIVAREEHARDRDAARLQRAERFEFGHRAIGREQAVGRPNAQDRLFGRREAAQLNRVGPPRKSRRIFFQAIDVYAAADRAAQISRQPFGQTAGVFERRRLGGVRSLRLPHLLPSPCARLVMF